MAQRATSSGPGKFPVRPLILVGLLFIVLFYAVPPIEQALAPDTGTYKTGLLPLLAINPIVVFATTLWFSSVRSHGWILPPLAALLAIPSFFLFYNETALVYAAFYLLSGYFGWLIALLLRKLGSVS